MLLTILGEYLLMQDAPVWQETVIGSLRALGYKVPAARQAIARSIADNWIAAERHGRRSQIRLTDAGRSMLSSGAERIYRFGEPWEWDGRWLLVVVRVPEQRREVRHRVRTRLSWEGFGSLGGGLWISPHVERELELAELAQGNGGADLISFRVEFGTIGEPEELVAAAWDLDRIEAEYVPFIERFGRLTPKGPEAMFCAQTELVHEWRRFPFLDPALPRQLLPRRWPLERAHAVFQRQHGRWHGAAQEFFRSITE